MKKCYGLLIIVEKIQTMSDNAVRTIKKMTWEQYNQKILDILKYLTQN